jgi:tRNA-specific 2-thiouridylase
MKVALLLSGGVDSSVALHRLLEAGHEVTAFYLKIWLEDELAFLGNCPWEDDLTFARAVCRDAGVPLEVLSLQREYHERVVHQAVEELRAGRTPSPDILCNRRVKFGVFREILEERHGGEFQRIASGHYARIETNDGTAHLLRGVDPKKDQTYFLFRLDQDQLRRCLFPLGGLTKAEVRQQAHALGLPNRDRKDSQGICFLGKVRFDDFVAGYLGEQPGPILEVTDGTLRPLGEHRGLWFHTIGQRRGLGLSGGPFYVVGKDPEHNTLYVAHADRLTRHHRTTCTLRDLHWIAGPPRRNDLEARVRHGPRTVACRLGSGENPTLQLAEGDAGLADGQVAVLYDGEECLGGGTLATSPEEFFEAQTNS